MAHGGDGGGATLFTSSIRLAPGVHLVERGPTTIQVGIDDARRILIRNAPPGTAELLDGLATDDSTAQVVDRVASRHCIPATTWTPLLTELAERGLLTPVGAGLGIAVPVACVPERAALASAYGAERASDSMRRRAEAVVVVVGTGRVAASVASVLASAGVGHVHPQPHRSLRATDVSAAGVRSADLPEAGASAAPARGSRSASPAVGFGGSRYVDRQTLAAVIRRVAPDARVHPPPSDSTPSLVVLATDGAPPPEVSRRMVTDLVAHLAVRASETRGVVGPLVLPRRSSCLHCHDLHRSDADPGWPQVRLALSRLSPVPPAVLATQVAAIAAGQVLDHIDGQPAAAIDATIELSVGDWVVRRRSWQPHPSCFCSSAPADPRFTAK